MRLRSDLLWPALRRLALLAAFIAPVGPLGAQVVACDFDIADDEGSRVWGNTLHLVGRAGASTNIGQFVIINANSAEMDVDHDGYAVGCQYNNLFVPQQFLPPLTNVDNPALSIPAENVIVRNLPRILASGQMARVDVYVELPPGTVAGRYLGRVQVRDSLIFAGGTASREVLNVDQILLEITVVEERSIEVLDPENDAPLDSVVIRARAGQTGTGAFRLANIGNAPLADIRLTASDLRSESAVGLVIPSSNVSFSIPNLSEIGVRDTIRVTVSVRVPRGILGGRYRGVITAQGQGIDPVQIPLIVIVTSTRGILFADNPVRGGAGAIARIAFNGDPGTQYRVLVFDMVGLMVWSDQGTVFAGVDGTPGDPTPGADFAVNYIWPLTNGVGELVASGMYLVVVESIVNGQRQLAQDKLMVIR